MGFINQKTQHFHPLIICSLDIISYFNMLYWDLEPDSIKASNIASMGGSFQYNFDDSLNLQEHQSLSSFKGSDSSLDCFTDSTPHSNSEASPKSFSQTTVLNGLQHVLSQVENDFLYMVE